MITFAEMRKMGVRGLLIYCDDYRCSHSIAISADGWPDDVRLSDIEPRFVCQAAAGAAPTRGRIFADVLVAALPPSPQKPQSLYCFPARRNLEPISMKSTSRH